MVMIAGRDYPTPLVVGGVAGVIILVAGQRLGLGGGGRDVGDVDPGTDAPSQLAPGATPVSDLGQFPAGTLPAAPADGGYDWWDPGDPGSPAFPPINPAPTPAPAPSPSPAPAPAPAPAPSPTPTAPAPAPAPAPTYPAGTAAKAIFPAGTYQTAVVSGTPPSIFERYGASMTTGGFSAWASKVYVLRNRGTGASTSWFKVLSGSHAGKWFYRWDARIRWQPV